MKEGLKMILWPTLNIKERTESVERRTNVRLRESRLWSGARRIIVSIEERTVGDHEGNTELEQLKAEPARAQAQLTEQQDELTATRSKLADADMKQHGLQNMSKS